MSGNPTEKSGKCSEVFLMSAVAEASHLLRQLAEPRPVGDTIKAAINRAARRVKIKAGRVEDIWRQEARAVRAEEMDAIRRAVMEEARLEYSRLVNRIASIEATLRRSDPDFHSTDINGLRELQRDAGSLDRSVDRGGER
jgi:hypothetical protein